MGRITDRLTERMSDKSFIRMKRLMGLIDRVFPYIDRRMKNFDIRPGMTVVDYGCGPGRYTSRLSDMVGGAGTVYAVDIHEKAIEAVEDMIRERSLTNVRTSLAAGNDEGNYDTKLASGTADVVCAFDMFFIIKKPKEFLDEIRRILKKNGVLYLDDGHQKRSVTRAKLRAAGQFEIMEETRDHLTCRVKH